MSVVFPKAKPINLLNSAAKSRSPEPVTVELFWEPWYCLEILIVDRGNKGQKEFGKTRLLTPSVPLKTDSQYDQRKQRKRFRKRAGLEATISHLKQHFRMGKCYLKGESGDQINVILAAAAYNLRQWIRLRLDSFLVLFLKNPNFRIYQHLRLTNPYFRQTFSFYASTIYSL